MDLRFKVVAGTFQGCTLWFKVVIGTFKNPKPSTLNRTGSGACYRRVFNLGL